MNLSAPFVRRPAGTLMLAFGIFLLGVVSYSRLPIASLPAVERPTIAVYATLPGASSETIASSLAQPLESKLGLIPGIIEMASFNATGGTSIIVQFDLAKDIDEAASEVQAAINAAAPNLPKDLPAPPYYIKTNPGGFSVIALALTSKALQAGDVYNYADSVVVQKLSEVPGVARVIVSGADRKGVRIRVFPRLLANMNISLEQIRTAVMASTRNLPKGRINLDDKSYVINVNDQAKDAEDYRNVVVAYRDNAPVYLRDLAVVSDSVINDKLDGWFGDERAVLVYVFKQPNSNVVEIVDAVKALLPKLDRWLPRAIKVHLLFDRTLLIRASISDVQFTLTIAIILVVLTTAMFLRRLWATFIPALTIPVVLGVTMVAMSFCGYSLDNLSLMALAISIGFIIDDAIIVVENTARLMEGGDNGVTASLKSSSQMGFTIVSITGALLGALLPILFMPDVVGRYCREFGVTMAIAIVASAIITLTLTPMLCSRLLGRYRQQPVPINPIAKGGSNAVAFYMRTLDWTLTHPIVTVSVLLLMMMGTAGLFIKLPKGFMPTEDTGILAIRTVTTSNISFDAMDRLQQTVAKALLRDSSVDGLASYIGTDNGSPLNNGYITVSLKAIEERRASIEQVIAHIRVELAGIGGILAFFKPWQDLQLGVENSASRYQYTLIGSDPNELLRWSEIMRRRMLAMPQFTGVVSTAEVTGLEATLTVDRTHAAALGVTQLAIDNTLYDAFGQRQIATIYLPFNYSRVILEVDRAFQYDPAALRRNLFLSSDNTLQSSSPGFASAQPSVVGSINGKRSLVGAAPSSTSGTVPPSTSAPPTRAPAPVVFSRSINAIPLSTIMRFGRAHAAMWLRHADQFPSITISFDTAPGVSIGEAINSIRAAQVTVHLPDDIKAEFRGEAAAASQSWLTQVLLFVGAIFTIYVVLGMLYESYSHPCTILTTLPSAGFGALLGLTLAQVQFTIVTAIACVLVLGIVMKNAIMMVDFALAAQRREFLTAREAIKHAARLRVRPIIMTTLVTILSSIPIAVSTGPGHELRQPLGIALFSGLVVSQVLTLYTTPVIYLLVERLGASQRGPVAAWGCLL